MSWLRSSLGAFVVVGLALAVSEPGQAQDKKKKKGPIDPFGEPKGFHAGLSERYAVWHGKFNWHLRTTTAKKKHHFVGDIQVEGGTFEKVQSHDLESKTSLKDHWKLSSDRKKIHFDFKTDQGIDGIVFQVSPEARSLRFNLRIDGKHEARKIFIGQGNHHPTADAFTLPAHPKQKKKVGCEDGD